MQCPKCELGKIVKKRGKYSEFYGCDRFPYCDYIHKEKKKNEADPAEQWAREHGVNLEKLII